MGLQKPAHTGNLEDPPTLQAAKLREQLTGDQPALADASSEASQCENPLVGRTFTVAQVAFPDL